ncbi:MAG: 30S ribosomal protein S2 [Planctomycetota bacterium]|nr:30S ribosomal protein S2 [Planctomycetota bacterium]
MTLVSARELLEAGAHFGHRTSRRNPKMDPYIYGKRNKINIIDVRKTIRGIVTAYYFLRKISREGKQVLFVGTKRQAKDIVRTNAEKCKSPFVAERWLGGTLTNLRTVRSRVNRLIELEKTLDGPEKDKLSKKMLSSLNRERRKISRNLEGIRDMNELPGAIVVVDPNKEYNAVREARRLGVPIVAMLDTDCDPDPIDIPIPANDDAIRSIEIVVSTLARAVMEGRRMTADKVEAAVPDSPAVRTKTEKAAGTGSPAAEGNAGGGAAAGGSGGRASSGAEGSQVAARA